ncbi:MAG: LysM peptidoglycan-binding domain-containing protein [Actinomycetota bacterium]
MNKLKKFYAMVSAIAVVVVGIIAIPSERDSAEALNGSMFNPGLIISDSVFYDFGTMSVSDIQRFLDSKAGNCTTDPARPGCIKNFRLDTPAVAGSEGRCSPLPAKTNVSAAEAIFDVARACGINPRVILVTLQKEQSLITLGDPDKSRYDRAMGYNCPDTAPCAVDSLGFFNQIYKGAGQLKYYSNPIGPFTWLVPGKTISRPYHPKSTCGSQSFLLENKATAALYYYTPYVPNQAALDNLYGTGDSCSSYGNRNFWRFYSDWFGSPVAGGFLLKSAKTETFLIVDEVKYRVADPELLASLSPLGPVGTVSKIYLDSFPTIGDITPLVRNGNNDRYFFIDAGKRLRFESCDQVAAYGLSCDQAVTLTSSQLSALDLGGALTNTVLGESGDRYLIESGTLREVLNDASLASAGLTLSTPSPIRRAALSYLPVGKPIAQNLSLVANRTSGELGIVNEDTFYAIDAATAKDVDFSIWFQGAGSSLAATSIASLTAGPKIQSIVADETGNQYLLSKTGKRLIQDTANWIKNPPVLPQAILDAITAVEGDLIAPAVVRSTEKTELFLVTAGELRPIATEDRATVRSSLPNPTIHRIAPSALSQMTKGSRVIPPGAVVTISNTSKTFLVDGLNRLYRIPSTSQRQALGLPASRVVPKSALASYARSGAISGMKVICGGVNYLAVAGKYVTASDDIFSHFPLATRSLDKGTCATLELTTIKGSRFIVTPDAKYFLVQDGLKRPLTSKDQYLALRGDSPKVLKVDYYFAKLIPTGTAVKKGATSVSDAPSTSTDSAKTYTVKSGDTLSGIAAKFGTTQTKLMEINGITDPNRLSVGQILKLP